MLNTDRKQPTSLPQDLIYWCCGTSCGIGHRCHVKTAGRGGIAEGDFPGERTLRPDVWTRAGEMTWQSADWPQAHSVSSPGTSVPPVLPLACWDYGMLPHHAWLKHFKGCIYIQWCCTASCCTTAIFTHFQSFSIFPSEFKARV